LETETISATRTPARYGPQTSAIDVDRRYRRGAGDLSGPELARVDCHGISAPAKPDFERCQFTLAHRRLTNGAPGPGDGKNAEHAEIAEYAEELIENGSSLP